jgi:hypothetical protein
MPRVDADEILMEFCEYAGIPDDKDPHPNDFPKFLQFLETKHPDLVEVAFPIWRQWF